MADFMKFCRVDLHLTDRTVKGHIRQIRRLLRVLRKDAINITREDLRHFLSQFRESAPSTYANIIKSLRVFFRDYLGKPEMVETFKFPHRSFNPIMVPSKEDLKQFYEALKDNREKALFLLYASSGLRRDEALNLRKEDIDFNQRLIRPKGNSSRTKHTWVTFYNGECERVLTAYLKERRDNNPGLIPIGSRAYREMWHNGNQACSIKVSPQVLREWFCCELGRLEVPDRYVDAFCGRVPRTILAKHYSDYSPEKLRQIYNQADLKVLT